MRRSQRLWWLALAVSLLLHLALLGGPGWLPPQWTPSPEPPPFEARLAPLPPPPVSLSPPRPAPKVEKQPPAPRPPPPEVRPLPEPVAVMDVAPPGDPVVMEPAEPPPSPVEAAPVETPAPVAASVPPLNRLPGRLELRFKVHYGIAAGEQVLLWVDEGERYTLTSVAEASGLAGLFYRGKMVQISRGRITPHGLQPEEFWDQRGNKRSSGRFDPVNRMLTLEPSAGAPRHFSTPGDVQDVLSLFFQFALTAPPPEGRLSYTVFNGKKLRHYTYQVVGEEMLETALGEVKTLHLERLKDGDGRFEIWLAVDRHYLPVRILRSEESKVDVELVIRSIAGG